MFSFHKPKVYRSTQGCCICKAKSSSSRFTDSKKYETDFIECFQLTAPRKGEICNACVLLVKRFKRLPPGSERHWGHVVDARVGPGLKSMTKFKKRKEESLQQQKKQQSSSTATGASGKVNNGLAKADDYQQNVGNENSKMSGISSVPQRFCKIFKKTKKKKVIVVQPEKQHGIGSPGTSDDGSSPSSPLSYPSDSEETKKSRKKALANFNDLKNFVKNEFANLNVTDFNLFNKNTDSNHYYSHQNDHHQQHEHHQKSMKCISGKIQKRYTRKSYQPIKNNINNKQHLNQINFVDEHLWTKVKTCCGYILENKQISAMIIDVNTFKLCENHRQIIITKEQQQRQQFMSKQQHPQQQQQQVKDDGLIRQINNATNSILTTATHNKHQSNGNVTVEITSTPAATIRKTPTAMKKHQLYSKRQNLTEFSTSINASSNGNCSNDIDKTDSLLSVSTTSLTPSTITIVSGNVPLPSLTIPVATTTGLLSTNILTTTTTLSSSNSKFSQLTIPTISASCNKSISSTSASITSSSGSSGYLHKLKTTTDPSKVIKQSMDKIVPTPKTKSDFNMVKNIVKLCAEKSAKIKPLEKVLNATENLGNKFNDNSSDSGYEEIPVDQNVLKNSMTRPVILSNGIKLHVQPQNMVLAANLVGVNSLSVQQTQQISNMAVFKTSTKSRFHTDRVEEIIYPRRTATINQSSTANQPAW